MSESKIRNMEELASVSGISRPTLSKYFNNPDSVRASTRKKVEASIRELGYVLDGSAGALSSRSTRIIGALISTLGGSTFAATLDGLSSTVRKAGLHMLVAGTDYSSEREQDYLATFLAKRPDGLVLSESLHSKEAIALLARAAIPVVEVWDLPDAPIQHAVGFSNSRAAFSMVDHLRSTGKRRIALIGNQSGSDIRVRQRSLGYVTALSEFDLGDPRIVATDNHYADNVARGSDELAEVMRRWPDTDAVFCVNDYLALGALCQARRMGIDVPGQLAIAGFGDMEVSSEAGMGITTVHVPGHMIGQIAGEILVQTISGEINEPVTRDLGFKILPRSTSA